MMYILISLNDIIKMIKEIRFHEMGGQGAVTVASFPKFGVERRVASVEVSLNFPTLVSGGSVPYTPRGI